jgi:chaperonin GroES
MKKRTSKGKPSRKASSSKAKSISKGSHFKMMPLNDRIVLKPVAPEDEKTTASGIIIPDTVSKEKPEQGTVVAVGDGRWEDGKRVPLSVKVGDKVVFSRYGYDEVKLDGEEYYILREENILAVIK